MKYYLYIIIGLIISTFFFYNSYRNKADELSEYKRNLEVFTDSLIALSQLPPEIEYRDTIIYKDSIVYKQKKVFVEPNDSMEIFSDSICNDSIDVKVEVLANKVSYIKIEYSPIYKEVGKDVYIPKPYPVIREVEIEVPQQGLFVGAGVGFSDRFVGKVSLLYAMKNNSIISADYVRYGDVDFLMAGCAIKLKW